MEKEAISDKNNHATCFVLEKKTYYEIKDILSVCDHKQKTKRTKEEKKENLLNFRILHNTDVLIAI